jgi:uncharacterized protein (DUF2267 family)
MSLTSADAVERSVHKTNEWLSQLAAELETENREYAWRVLRAYLQLLRDELTLDEGAQLAAQLTTVLRGAFYDGFDPGDRPAKIRHRDEFLARFGERAQIAELGDAAHAVEAGTRVMRRHVTEGEVDDVLAQLPTEVREVLQSA